MSNEKRKESDKSYGGDKPMDVRIGEIIRDNWKEEARVHALLNMAIMDLLKGLSKDRFLMMVVLTPYNLLPNLEGISLLKKEGDGWKVIYGFGKHEEMTGKVLDELPEGVANYWLEDMMIAVEGSLEEFEKRFLEYYFTLASLQYANIVEVERLKEDLLRDTLTGAYTRWFGEKLLKHEAEKAKRNHTMFSLVFIDIDDLKEVNDKFGHSEGDKLLRNFVKAFQSATREEDILIRWGGDEFLAIFPESSYENTLKIMKRFEKFPISYGIAECPKDSIDPSMLIEKADKRMYRMKYQKRT
ncbi:MAG: GGDEF domain-containing protein [Thermotogaceae bacterium]|nr:GGDEF domain-containing protein [Thermotogaceae bacterium]